MAPDPNIPLHSDPDEQTKVSEGGLPELTEVGPRDGAVISEHEVPRGLDEPRTRTLSEDLQPKRGLEEPRLGAPYDPARFREWLRGLVALGLVVLLIGIVTGSYFLVWTNKNTNSVKDWLTAVLTPIVGLVGAVTGFYYGGRESER